jgi:hypothetical protein
MASAWDVPLRLFPELARRAPRIPNPVDTSRDSDISNNPPRNVVIPRIFLHDNASTTEESYILVRDEKVHDALLQLGMAFGECTAFVQPEDAPQHVNRRQQRYGLVAQMDRAAVS